MSVFSDFFNNTPAISQGRTTDIATILRARAALLDRTSNIPDPMIDAQWAGYSTTNAPHSYFDYYFSGQDIQVFIDGIEGVSEFATLPISDFSFNIVQQKMPIYGYWSYTYDAVARGNRLINGSFRLVTKSPDYMRRALEAAAEARQNRVNAGVSGSYSYYRGLTPDDANIQKYWSNNLDPALASTGKQIFSTHPPFTFVIVYGVQAMSLDATNASLPITDGSFNSYQLDNPMYQDTNERLVDSDPIDQANRIVIDDCELVNMSSEYHSTGQLIVEDYQFFARDIIIPSRNSSIQSTVLPAG